MTSTPKQMTTTTEAESGERIDLETDREALIRLNFHPDTWEAVKEGDGPGGMWKDMREMAANTADLVLAAGFRRLTPPSLQPSPADDRGMDIVATVVHKKVREWYGFGTPEDRMIAEIVATIRREWELQGIALTEVD